MDLDVRRSRRPPFTGTEYELLRLEYDGMGWSKISGTWVDSDMSNDVWLWWPLMSKCFLCSPRYISERVGMECCIEEVFTRTEV